MTLDMKREPEARDLRSTFRRIGYLVLMFGLIALLLIWGGVWWSPSESAPQPVAAEHEEENAGVVLTLEQRAAGGIALTPLQASPLPRVFRAPGEVRTNDYTTSIVGPRITATVIEREAQLGDKVVTGQPLVTLYSMEMAEAQSAFLLAQREVERFENLEDIVAGRLIDEATVNRQEALGRLASYGLTQAQISNLTAQGLSNNTIGQFILTAPQSGSITRDEFRIGDVVEPGKMLFEISDLRDVWVEAQVSPALLSEMVGEKGLIIAGGLTREAQVVQRRETVDEATRTVGIRLQVDNSDGVLKPGQFVDVELYGAEEPVLAIPTAAVLRLPDGDWAVYVENADGSFVASEVEVLYAANDLTAIAGIPLGTRVVTSGAFFVAAEAAKSGFEIHNH